MKITTLYCVVIEFISEFYHKTKATFSVDEDVRTGYQPRVSTRLRVKIVVKYMICNAIFKLLHHFKRAKLVLP